MRRSSRARAARYARYAVGTLRHGALQTGWLQSQHRSWLVRLQGSKRQTAPSQTNVLNAYQTHQNINQASRRALQPAEGGRARTDVNCQDMVYDLREIQGNSDHRRGLPSDAKRRAAYLDSVLQVRRSSSTTDSLQRTCADLQSCARWTKTCRT